MENVTPTPRKSLFEKATSWIYTPTIDYRHSRQQIPILATELKTQLLLCSFVMYAFPSPPLQPQRSQGHPGGVEEINPLSVSVSTLFSHRSLRSDLRRTVLNFSQRAMRNW